jgi:hypothetical protein
MVLDVEQVQIGLQDREPKCVAVEPFLGHEERGGDAIPDKKKKLVALTTRHATSPR